MLRCEFVIRLDAPSAMEVGFLTVGRRDRFEYQLRKVAINVFAMQNTGKGNRFIFNKQTDSVITNPNSISSVGIFQFFQVSNAFDRRIAKSFLKY